MATLGSNTVIAVLLPFLRSAAGVPNASEPGQMLTNLLKGHAVAPIILAGSSKTYTTGLSVGRRAWLSVGFVPLVIVLCED